MHYRFLKWMEVNNQLHGLVTLPLAKGSQLPILYEAGWASDPF